MTGQATFRAALLALGLAHVITYAQTNSAESLPLLPLSEALRLGQASNLSLQKSAAQVNIANNDLSAARGSQLPSLSLLSDYGRVGPNFKGDPMLNPASRTQYDVAWKTGISAKWVVFDGFAAWANVDSRRAALEAAMARGITQGQLVNAQVSLAYHEVVRQQALHTLRSESFAVTQERLRIASARHKLGVTGVLDEQQATLDRNADSAAWLKSGLALQQARRQLNSWLARDPETPFRADSLVALDSGLDRAALLALAKQNSPALKEARIKLEATKADAKVAAAIFYPNVALYAGYNFLEEYSGDHPGTNVHAQGTLYGVQLSMPLYEGGRSSAAIKSADEQVRLAEFNLRELELKLENDFAQAYAQYAQALAGLALEESNAGLADSALAMAMGQYRIGAIASVDLKRVQDSQLEARSRAVSARFDAKAAEILVKWLAGK